MITEQIGTEIATARERAGISIQEIAEATRINTDYLESIEKGDFNFLPQPYVVAYIKLFASRVGLDGEALAKKWTDSLKQQQGEDEPETSESESLSPASTAVRSGVVLRSGARLQKSVVKEFGVGMSIIAVLAFIFYLANTTGSKSETEVESASAPETIPIMEVIKQNEARFDSIAKIIPELRSQPAAPPEPFVLRLNASDTVWVQITIDDETTQEYLFRPGQTHQWEAKSSFLLRTGNAGATHLFRNGVALEPLGKPGQVRRVRITRDEVKRE